MGDKLITPAIHKDSDDPTTTIVTPAQLQTHVIYMYDALLTALETHPGTTLAFGAKMTSLTNLVNYGKSSLYPMVSEGLQRCFLGRQTLFGSLWVHFSRVAVATGRK